MQKALPAEARSKEIFKWEDKLGNGSHNPQGVRKVI